MIAEVEQPDGTYKKVDMPAPSGCFFCDTCGDCLRCDHRDLGLCWDGGEGRWVIYLNDELNPNFVARGV